MQYRNMKKGQDVSRDIPLSRFLFISLLYPLDILVWVSMARIISSKLICYCRGGKPTRLACRKILLLWASKMRYFSSCKSCCNQQDIFTIYLLLPEKQHRICALNGTRNCFRYSSTMHDKSEGLNWDQVLY